jgi:Tol biopolymer transport system component
MKVRLIVSVLALSLASSAPAQYFGKNKVRYDTFAWKVYPTPHFRISFYDRVEPSLPKLASFAESAYDELARKLNYQIAQPIPLIAFASHAEFEQNNVIVEFIPEGVGAFAVPARNRMVLPVDMPDERLQQIIQHELTHVFQFEIMYQGRLGKALAMSPPQWFMEGMASYFGNDEDAMARAVMRDAVASDHVPSVMYDVQGYAAYRFGHMVFQFVEAEWGLEGLRDFIYEFRNTLGSGVEKALKRAFDIEPEEFDARFRAWLRKYYQPAIGDRADPREFGREFRISGPEGTRSYETSPIVSPSGDLVAAFSTYRDDVDIVLLGVPDRKLFRTLTPHDTTSYQYLVAQMLTVGPDRGRDLAFSPTGDRVAAFARYERGRLLVFFNTLSGGIERVIHIPVDQAMEPVYSPDGATIAFHAYAGGRADIYLLDLATERLTNLTNDDAYDSDPIFTRDGKSIVYSSQSAENAKLFEISVANPKERRQLTFGPGNDEGSSFSRDGKRLYFTSDRDAGIFDVYMLDLDTHALTRLTKVVGAATNPIAVPTRDGERVVYQAYTKGHFWLYETDPAQGKPAGKEEAPQEVKEREAYVPAVTVNVSKDKIEPVKKRKLFIDGAQVLVGVNSDSTLISQTYLSFADQYGDSRLNLLLESVSGFSNFQFTYLNLTNRLQWGATVFDTRQYYVYATSFQGNLQRQQIYRETGGAAFVQYPLSIYHRVEGAVGYIDRTAAYPFLTQQGLVFLNVADKIPFVQASFTGDTVFWQNYGPHGGHRYQLTLTNAFSTGGGGTLSRDVVFDARQYLPLSRRNELAVRLRVAVATGAQPDIFYFGGLDTLRGFDYNTLVGNRTAYVNAEWRFPLIDQLALPWLKLSEVRGRFFLDVGGAYFDYPGFKQDFTCISGGRLQDCVSSYGFGMSLYLFGLPVNWDFSKQWDFKQTLSRGSQTSFWVGFQF